VGGEIFALVPTGPGAYPAIYRVRTGSFLGVKLPGRGVDNPPTSSAEVRERVQLHVCSPYGPSWPVLGWSLVLPEREFPLFAVGKNFNYMFIEFWDLKCYFIKLRRVSETDRRLVLNKK